MRFVDLEAWLQLLVWRLQPFPQFQTLSILLVAKVGSSRSVVKFGSGVTVAAMDVVRLGWHNTLVGIVGGRAELRLLGVTACEVFEYNRSCSDLNRGQLLHKNADRDIAACARI
jgi:hypothetical protein